jgi:AcrR family transcriptional regulator
MVPATPVLTEPTRLRAKKKERTRLAIEDAALELFAEQGYEDTTVDQIATRAEVSKATFFRYFASKGEVVFGGDDDDRHHDLQQAIIRRHASEDALTAVRRAMQEEWLPALDPRRTTRQTRAARTSPLLRGLSYDLSLRWQADVSDALALRRGLDQPDRQCRVVAALAFLVMSDAVNLWLDGNCTGDLARVFDEGFDLLEQLRGGTRR